MKMSRISLLLLSAALMLPLAACQTTGNYNGAGNIDAALERAADNASSRGASKESLALMERIYMRDSANRDNALKYAMALRDAGRLNRAAMVLSPFAEGHKESDAEICLEYASIMTEMGDYPVAETHARQAILKNPESAQGYHVLGIALDAQGHNKQAEVAFRKALEMWEGDPTPVLNNLGLNLATQGFIDEAVDTLRKAASLAPERTEIERNLRIVSALQVQPPVSGSRLIPMPPRRKPERPAG